MESICTAETAEDAEIALLRPSAISAVSAVPPAFGPRILWKKMPRSFHGKIARFIAVAVDDSQSPNQAPEPTTMAVTPRAASRIFELKPRTPNRQAARGAPAMVVAHL